MLIVEFIKNRTLYDISYYERNGSFSGGGYFKIFEENFITSLCWSTGIVLSKHNLNLKSTFETYIACLEKSFRLWTATSESLLESSFLWRGWINMHCICLKSCFPSNTG